jgi:hypothetical protein
MPGHFSVTKHTQTTRYDHKQPAFAVAKTPGNRCYSRTTLLWSKNPWVLGSTPRRPTVTRRFCLPQQLVDHRSPGKLPQWRTSLATISRGGGPVNGSGSVVLGMTMV